MVLKFVLSQPTPRVTAGAVGRGSVDDEVPAAVPSTFYKKKSFEVLVRRFKKKSYPRPPNDLSWTSFDGMVSEGLGMVDTRWVQR